MQRDTTNLAIKQSSHYPGRRQLLTQDFTRNFHTRGQLKILLIGARVTLVCDWCARFQQSILGHNPLGRLKKFTQRRIPCRFCFVSSWNRTWHGTICNCNLSCPTKSFHRTKRICQVTFNIYIVGVVSVHSPLSLHSRSIPTVNRLMQKQQAQVAFFAFPLWSPVVSMEDFIKSVCKRQDDFL